MRMGRPIVRRTSYAPPDRYAAADERPRRTSMLGVAIGLLLVGAATAVALLPNVPATAAVGSRPAWTRTFERDVAPGAVGQDGSFPGYSDVWAYPDGTRSTHGGRYAPSRVNSIAGGSLVWRITGDRVGSSVTVGPSAVGGEWSIRMRTDVIAGMHIANMLWPDNEVWPGVNGSGGEIDFPEEDLNGAHPYAAVVGNAGETRDGQQLFYPLGRATTPFPWTEWHTYTTRLDPGRSVTLLQDGAVVARVTENVPRTAVHEQFQVESSTAAGGGSGSVQLSAVAYSPNLDGSSARAVEAGDATATPSSQSAASRVGSAAPTSSSSPARSASADPLRLQATASAARCFTRAETATGVRLVSKAVDGARRCGAADRVRLLSAPVPRRSVASARISTTGHARVRWALDPDARVVRLVVVDDERCPTGVPSCTDRPVGVRPHLYSAYLHDGTVRYFTDGEEVASTRLTVDAARFAIDVQHAPAGSAVRVEAFRVTAAG